MQQKLENPKRKVKKLRTSDAEINTDTITAITNKSKIKNDKKSKQFLSTV